MSLECFASVVERQKPTANGFNKPKQKNSYVRYALLKQPLRGVVENGVLKI